MNIAVNQFNITKVFFTIFLLELFLGGAGRLTTFGALTLRMYLFIIGMVLLVFLLFKGAKITRMTTVVTLTFTCLFMIAIERGLFNSGDYSYLFADVKMLLFFFILPLFDVAITHYSDVDKIIKLLKIAAFILAVFYFIFLIILHFEIYSFTTIWLALSKPEYHKEFGFRGEVAMVYKGFIYLCVGFFFFFFEKRSLKSILLATFVFAAVILTLSRAFILLIFLLTITYILYKVVFSRKNKTLNITVISLIIIGGSLVVPRAIEMLGDKSESDVIRVLQVTQVVDMVNPISFLIGHGFGVGTEIRPGHMEIMYLEIFHKQGLLGIAFWLALLIYIIIKYYNYYRYCKEKGLEDKLNAKAFLYGTIFIYAQSLFNPFLTNSMGLTFLFITLIVFENLKKFNEEKNISLHSDL